MITSYMNLINILPEVTDILALKHECTPVIEQICEDIRFDSALRDSDFLKN